MVVVEIPEHLLLRRYEMAIPQVVRRRNPDTGTWEPNPDFFAAWQLPVELVNQYPARIETSEE